MREESYDRPLVEPDNMFTGGFQTGRFDAGPGKGFTRRPRVVLPPYPPWRGEDGLLGS